MIYFLGQNRSNLHHVAAAAGTAIFEGLETLLRLARDARARGWGQGPVAVAGSVVGVFF